MEVLHQGDFQTTMENKKWKRIAAILAIALVLTIIYSEWKKFQTQEALLNEFVLNISAYAQYAVPAIEEFEKNRDQAAFAERMNDLHAQYLLGTYHYSFGVIGEIAPDVAHYNMQIVDRLYFGLGFNIRNAENGVIGKSDMIQIAAYKEVLRDHQNFVRNNPNRSITEMRYQLDKEVEALK